MSCLSPRTHQERRNYNREFGRAKRAPHRLPDDRLWDSRFGFDDKNWKSFRRTQYKVVAMSEESNEGMTLKIPKTMADIVNHGYSDNIVADLVAGLSEFNRKLKAGEPIEMVEVTREETPDGSLHTFSDIIVQYDVKGVPHELDRKLQDNDC